MMSRSFLHGQSVFLKTAKGQEEIATRAYRLNSRYRRLLIMMDGTKTLNDIVPLLPEGESDRLMPFLVQQGFLATRIRQEEIPDTLIQASRPIAQIKDFMIVTARDHIGLLATEVIRRIDSANNAAELGKVVGYWVMALHESRHGMRIADSCLAQVKNALASDEAEVVLPINAPKE
jgi:hypothetical protein